MAEPEAIARYQQMENYLHEFNDRLGDPAQLATLKKTALNQAELALECGTFLAITDGDRGMFNHKADSSLRSIAANGFIRNYFSQHNSRRFESTTAIYRCLFEGKLLRKEKKGYKLPNGESSTNVYSNSPEGKQLFFDFTKARTGDEIRNIWATNEARKQGVRKQVKEAPQETYTPPFMGGGPLVAENLKEAAIEAGSCIGVTYSVIYEDELNGTKPIQYKVVEERLHHDLQNLAKAIRRKMLKGWYDYDINAAAITILLQQVLQLRSMYLAEHYPHLLDYLENKDQRRQEMAARLNINIDEVKRILAAAIFGSKFQATNFKSKMYKRYANIGGLYQAICTDPWFVQLLTDIKKINESTKTLAKLNPYLKQKLNLTPVERKLRPAALVALVYRRLERMVLDSCIRFAVANGLKLFLMHDGFNSDKQVDRKALEAHILSETGFALTFSEQVL